MNIIPIYQSLLEHALLTPTKLAVLSNDDVERINYEELSQLVSTMAAGLKDIGVMPKQLVAVTSDDPVKHLITVMASMSIGAVPVALPNTHAADLERIISDAMPVLTICFETSQQVVGATDHDEILSRGFGLKPTLLTREAESEDVAMIYYTSGTTSGVPKGVMQPHRELESTVRNIIDIMNIDGSIVEFLATPTETGFWFGRCRTVLRVGGTLVLNRRSLNSITVLDSLKRFGCNAITGDSPIFSMLATKFEKRTLALGAQMRWSKVASQALAPALKARISDLWPNAQNVMNYGLMEAMRVSILSFRDNPDKLASVGRPCPGVTVKITNDRNEELPSGTVGEVNVRGENVASGYYNKEDLWQQRFQNGWYATGDLGFLDGDGFLHIDGRKDEAINVGGKTISPIEIEMFLNEHLIKTSFHVCGVKDPEGILGDVPVLCVKDAWDEPISWLEWKSQVQRHLPRAFIPRLAVLVPQFPFTSNGKLQRDFLRKQVEEGRFESL